MWHRWDHAFRRTRAANDTGAQAMTKHAHTLVAGPSGGLVSWLAWGAVGPAAVALPTSWAADKLAGAAVRWFKRFRKTDDLSRLVKTATGTIGLNGAEFKDLRKLLEKEGTWSLLAGREVKDLACRIAACLPLRDGRTEEASREAAAWTIARGLLEFAVFDLEPDNFQKVVLARLQQMADQATALDKALFDLHSDLYAHLADATDLLKRVMDRLPPGPAGRGEIAVYLRTLIDWLNTDPWPRDPRFGGPVLTPAVIERKLRITAKGRDREQDLDADGLAQQCMRLVILGGPGAGKTWLAKRTARCCAEDALEFLAAGGTLDEVELPLYTTCSRLFGAGGGIREAVVSSALDQLADLGGSRISAALSVFFAERSAPTLLVIDSLDEAHGPSERLHQASTLPWRIVLTSRPSSWRNQLTINDTDESHRVGELQPLRYPGDVEPFIERWFAGQSQRGNDLAAQIARRPGLQQAATVPLVLAFYCIVGGTEPLPEFRRDLYTRVLNRMLTGRWRDDAEARQPDADTCLLMLRAWAWDGAASNHPVSGVGMWVDDIPTKQAQLSPAGQDAVDHVATPLGLPDVDTRKTLRRFIHRSIREHLVAEHVAELPVNKAVKALLPHLWYDPDWEYAAPAAIAMHPKGDKVLQALICRAARCNQIPGDVSVIDGEWELRGLLARAAAESSEANWSPEVAAMIGQARVELARSARTGDLGGAAWGTSNSQAREALLGSLAGQVGRDVAKRLVAGVVQLAPTAEDKHQAREALLGLLARKTDGRVAAELVAGVVQLDPTAVDTRRARELLLRLLARKTDGETAAELAGGLAQLDPTAEDTRRAREALLRLLPSQTEFVADKLLRRVVKLDLTVGDMRQARAALLEQLSKRSLLVWVDRFVQLAPTAEDKRQAREALLGLLADDTPSWKADRLVPGIVQLAPTAEDKRQAREALLRLLARKTDGHVAAGIVQLAPTAEDKRQAREALLRLLAGQTDVRAAAALAGGLAQLAPTAEDTRQAREALLRLLAGETDVRAAAALAGGLAELAPTAEDRRQSREALLGLLADETDGETAAALAGGLAQLAPTAEDTRQARELLLRLLAGQDGSWEAEYLALGVAELDPTPEDRRRARELLLGQLTGYPWRLVPVVVQLAPTAEDKRQAREALLGLLARGTDGETAAELAGGLAELDPTAEDKRQAREALLRLLAGQDGSWEAEYLALRVAELDPTAEDKRQAREALLRLLAGQNLRSWEAEYLALGVADLDPTPEDRRRAREALLGLLADETAADLDSPTDIPLSGGPADELVDEQNDELVSKLVDVVVELAPTAEDKRQAREALLGLLARETDEWLTAELVSGVIQLDPTVHDLSTWRARAIPPTVELLAAVRRNSALDDWLKLLPSLSPVSC